MRLGVEIANYEQLLLVLGLSLKPEPIDFGAGTSPNSVSLDGLTSCHSEYSEESACICDRTFHFDSKVDYIRFGYPYCLPLSKFLWPAAKIAEAIQKISISEKIAQFCWPITFDNRADSYLNDCIDILNNFPRSEIVFTNWGGVKLPFAKHRMTAYGLSVYNSDIVRFLKNRGISKISLPAKLDIAQLTDIIALSPDDVEFEYQLWGNEFSTYWWKCAAYKDACNPQICSRPVEFTYKKTKLDVIGQAVYKNPGVDNLAKTGQLADIGISRGLIQLSADMPVDIEDRQFIEN